MLRGEQTKEQINIMFSSEPKLALRLNEEIEKELLTIN